MFRMVSFLRWPRLIAHLSRTRPGMAETNRKAVVVPISIRNSQFTHIGWNKRKDVTAGRSVSRTRSCSADLRKPCHAVTAYLWRNHACEFGMNLLLWTGSVTDDHFPLLSEIKAWGFDGAEMALFDTDDAQVARTRRELDNLGLACTTGAICSPRPVRFRRVRQYGRRPSTT